MKIYHPGFTLIELIIVIAIAGVLAAVASPYMGTMIKNNRLATNINDLTGDLSLARSESLKRGTRVTVCSSTNGTSCATSADWAKGRIVFVDHDADGVVDAGDEILRVSSILKGGNTLVFADTAPTSLAYVQYRPKGVTNATLVSTFRLCDDRTGSVGRTIAISLTGRATLTTNTTCP